MCHHSIQSTSTSQNAPDFFATLTGADDSIDHADLWQLASLFRPGLVEWGILYSASNQGVGRYPSFEWIEKLVAMMGKPGTPRFSLHICGRAVEHFLEGVGHVTQIARAFPRVQINFRSRDHHLDIIKAMMDRNSDKTIITQHNYANAALWRNLREFNNHAILFDESGGRGLSPITWPSAIDGVASGYAGGLGLSNIEQELPCIQRAAGGDVGFWIDAEGKLRDTQDRFDLRVVRQYLDLVAAFDRTLAAGLSKEHA